MSSQVMASVNLILNDIIFSKTP